MIATIVDRALNVYHGIPRQKALGHGVLHTSIDCRDKATWNSATLNSIDKLISSTGIRLKAKPAVTKLTRTSGLLLMTTLSLGCLANGLAVRNTHRHQARLNA